MAQGERISEWFTRALGMRCWLVRQLPGSRHAVQQRQLAQQQRTPEVQHEDDAAEAGIQDAGTRHSIGGSRSCSANACPMTCWKHADASWCACPWIGFANEAQFLAISDASLADVNCRLQTKPSGKQQLLQVPPTPVCVTSCAPVLRTL